MEFVPKKDFYNALILCKQQALNNTYIPIHLHIPFGKYIFNLDWSLPLACQKVNNIVDCQMMRNEYDNVMDFKSKKSKYVCLDLHFDIFAVGIRTDYQLYKYLKRYYEKIEA